MQRVCCHILQRMQNSQASCSTIFPKCSLAFMTRWASAACSSGRTRSTTGRIRPLRGPRRSGAEACDELRLLLARRGPQRRADHLQAPREKRGRGRSRPLAPPISPIRTAAAHRSDRQVPLQVGGSDRVEHDDPRRGRRSAPWRRAAKSALAVVHGESAPSSRQRPHFSSEPAVTTMRPPAALTSWMAAVPIPLAAAVHQRGAAVREARPAGRG